MVALSTKYALCTVTMQSYTCDKTPHCHSWALWRIFAIPSVSQVLSHRLLEKPGVGASLATQTHACFEGHLLVYETTRQQRVEVSSGVLIYTACKTHLSLLGTLSIILNFLCWCRWCA